MVNHPKVTSLPCNHSAITEVYVPHFSYCTAVSYLHCGFSALGCIIAPWSIACQNTVAIIIKKHCRDV